MEIYQTRLNSIHIEHQDIIESYHSLSTQIQTYKKDFRDVITNPNFLVPFLQPGRLIRIKIDKKTANDDGDDGEDLDFGWGVLVNFQKRIPMAKNTPSNTMVSGPIFVCDVLLSVDKSCIDTPTPAPTPGDAEMIVVPCALSSIESLSSVKIFLPKDLKVSDGRKQVLKTIREIEKRFSEKGVPVLDPIGDMGIRDESFVKLVNVSNIIKVLN